MRQNLFIFSLVILGMSQPVFGADEPDIDIDYHKLGVAYAHLVSFTAEPEVAAGRYTIDSEDPLTDDSTLKTTKLPLYKEFTSDDHDWSWYLQGAVNYSSLEQKTNFQFDAPFDGTSDIEWKGYGALLEAGVIFPLSQDFSWSAGAGVGVSRLENEVDYSSAILESIFEPINGTVFNWETNVSTLRANIGLLYDREYGLYGFKGSAHYTYSQIDSFDESSQFSGFSEDASTLTLKLDVKHPLAYEIRNSPLYLIGHIGSTNFVGSNKDELGFDSFGELGLSFGLKKVSLGALAIIGGDVSGWNLILNYDY
jgi:hypothetical protein